MCHKSVYGRTTPTGAGMVAGGVQPACQFSVHKSGSFVEATCPSQNAMLIEPGMPTLVEMANRLGAREPCRATVYLAMSLPTSQHPLYKSLAGPCDSKGKLSHSTESANTGTLVGVLTLDSVRYCHEGDAPIRSCGPIPAVPPLGKRFGLL